MANEIGGLSGTAIRRPVFTAMVMLGLVVLGFFSFRRLPIDQFPDVDLPVVTVQTIYPGASPETIEREVTRRMEEAFNPVNGVDRITSVTLEGVSQVMVEFDLGVSVDQAAQDLRDKIEAIRRDLPADIEQPIVQKLDPAAAPIVSLALNSDQLPIPQLTVLADEDIRRHLESIPGVGEVRISGGLEREVRVFLQPERMQSVGVSVPEIMAALQRQNLEAPACLVDPKLRLSPRSMAATLSASPPLEITTNVRKMTKSRSPSKTMPIRAATPTPESGPSNGSCPKSWAEAPPRSNSLSGPPPPIGKLKLKSDVPPTPAKNPKNQR